ncbi:hypothetical protein Q5P01_022671 [Channa striata]|uniref:Macrophage mannose receptor 1 n=1 Tax=Channa striata TaxID=64152 RepID=A0AA88RW18_CHASR|nr:hypothetical protein Q5P01_022671 [Channa striata]
MRITCAAVVLLIQALHCLGSDDSAFQLINKATSFCLVKQHNICYDIQWTTGDRLLVTWTAKCLGSQGKTVGSEISLYDCDEESDFQKWECKNENVLALKGQELYIELTADNTAVLSKTIGPNNHLTISGTSSGACTRTYREYYTIGGNAFGRPCMFPFYYKDRWYTECTDTDSPENRLWCAVETKYHHELWGFCPTNSKENWKKNVATGTYYQLNTESALTWSQAEASCKQQSASLLSITDPHHHAYLTALLETAGRGKGDMLWTGLNLNSEHGWQWSNGRPFRYLNWDSGHPLPYPGYSCGIVNGAVQYSWQSSQCNKKLGYICISDGAVAAPTEAPETGFCPSPWIPYNGHCFHLFQTKKTWSDAQQTCRKEGGDLVSIHNVEDQSFVISQLGYKSTDELWIGLNDKKTEGLFDWSDHSTVSFTTWEFGKPAVSTNEDDCVLMSGENGNWADSSCKDKHGFICMKTSASEPTGDEVEQNIGCKTGWKRHGSYCYFVGTMTKTFDEAKEDCKSSDSYLADVSTGVDNAFLVSLVGLRPEKYFWLGLSNQKTPEFVWTNTDSVRFTHWNTEMPGHHQGCVAIKTGIFAGLWDVLPCTNKEKYICKHLADGEVPTPRPPTVPPPKCADGWNHIGTQNYCSKTFIENSDKRTWYEARDYCRTIGGDLLSIHTNIELRGPSLRYKSVWIGLYAPDPSTGYVWSDRSPVNFQNWEEGEPNNKNNAESCVEINPYTWYARGSWRDVHCEKKNGWICQIRAGVTPKPPPDPVSPDYNRTSDGWLELNGTQYYINTKSMAMEDARHFCQQRHGDLVTINSEAENIFLWQQISEQYSSYWIGLSVDLDGSFEWMDGSPVIFQRWQEGQPDFKNYDENCVVMRNYDGFWHDYNCGYEQKSICKRRGSTPANTTAAPTVPPKGGCQPGWKKFNFKCYSIIKNQKLKWDEARKQCQSMGGNLASISSKHVQVFLMSQMADTSPTNLWIGMHSLYGGQFWWTDGQPRSYTNFVNTCAVINTSPQLGIGKWIPKSCNDSNGFICLQNPVTSLPDSPETTTSTNYVKICNDSIKVVTQQLNWDTARKNCEDDGANLASLRNEWIQAYVELMAKNLKAPLWIGLNKNKTNGYFRYIDGWHIGFTQWGKDESITGQPCVYVDVDGKWKTTSCNHTISSVCLKSEDLPPTESTVFPGVCPVNTDGFTADWMYWQPFNGYCYIFFTEEASWADAATNCVKHGGALASIEDPSEQEYIQSNVKAFEDSHTSFWIGLFKTHRGQWVWLDKKVMDYTNWGEDKPDDLSYGSIATANGLWKTSREYSRKPYICKTPKVSQIKPSPTEVVIKDNLRGHITVALVLAISGIAMGSVIAFVIFKKRGANTPVSDNLTNFANPLFFSNNETQHGIADPSTLVENAKDENTEPIITI